MMRKKTMFWLEAKEQAAYIAFGWLVVSLLFAGCASNHLAPPPLTMEDLMVVATDAAVASLLESGVLDRAARHPAVLAIGRIRNETSCYFNMSLLTDNIRTSLVKSGKVVVIRDGLNPVDSPVDPSVKSDALPHPDFTLSGRVVEMIERTANNKQIAYMFSFSLSDSNGMAIWSENKTITKLTKRPPAL